MENATKALLIAGTVLLAIIMVSIAVYLYSLYSNQADQYSEMVSTTEIQKFNSKFDIYIGRKNITAQEIVSIANLAKEYNNQIVISLAFTRLEFPSLLAETPEEFIKKYKDDLFQIISYTYDDNGKLTMLFFTGV